MLQRSAREDDAGSMADSKQLRASKPTAVLFQPLTPQLAATLLNTNPELADWSEADYSDPDSWRIRWDDRRELLKRRGKLKKEGKVDTEWMVTGAPAPNPLTPKQQILARTARSFSTVKVKPRVGPPVTPRIATKLDPPDTKYSRREEWEMHMGYRQDPRRLPAEPRNYADRHPRTWETAAPDMFFKGKRRAWEPAATEAERLADERRRRRRENKWNGSVTQPRFAELPIRPKHLYWTKHDTGFGMVPNPAGTDKSYSGEAIAFKLRNTKAGSNVFDAVPELRKVPRAVTDSMQEVLSGVRARKHDQRLAAPIEWKDDLTGARDSTVMSKSASHGGFSMATIKRRKEKSATPAVATSSKRTTRPVAHTPATNSVEKDEVRFGCYAQSQCYHDSRARAAPNCPW